MHVSVAERKDANETGDQHALVVVQGSLSVTTALPLQWGPALLAAQRKVWLTHKAIRRNVLPKRHMQSEIQQHIHARVVIPRRYDFGLRRRVRILLVAARISPTATMPNATS